jgi:hypothetical protein
MLVTHFSSFAIIHARGEKMANRGGTRSKAGRPGKDLLVGSIFEAITPYRVAYANAHPFEIATAAAQSIAFKYPNVQKVLEAWGLIVSRDRLRSRALDDCITSTGMELEEFKGLVLAVLKSNALTMAEVEVSANLLKMVRTSIDVATTPERDKDNRVLIRHLEKNQIFNPPPGQVTHVNVNANAQAVSLQSGERKPPPAFEDFQLDLDRRLREAEQKRLNAVPAIIEVEPTVNVPASFERMDVEGTHAATGNQ